MADPKLRTPPPPTPAQRESVQQLVLESLGESIGLSREAASSAAATVVSDRDFDAFVRLVHDVANESR